MDWNKREMTKEAGKTDNKIGRNKPKNIGLGRDIQRNRIHKYKQSKILKNNEWKFYQQINKERVKNIK